MAYSIGGVEVRAPDRGWQSGYERVGGVHQLLAGGRVMDIIGFKRRFECQWTSLTNAEYARIEGRFLSALPMTLVLSDGTTFEALFTNLSKTVRVAGLVDAAATFLEA